MVIKEYNSLSENPKDAVQLDIVTKLQKNGYHGIVAGATGIGKAKITIDAIMLLSQTVSVEILWVVPTSLTRDITIPDEWKKWGHEAFLKSNVKIICYKSLHKETKHYTIIVLDEGHNITLRAYSGDTMRHRRYQGVICLTATTPTEELKIKIFKHMRLKIVAEISVDEAVDMELVAPYQVYVFPVPMGHILDFEVNTKKTKTTPAKRYVTSEHNRYFALQNRIGQFPKGSAPAALYFARMQSIYRFKSKLEAARVLLDKIPDSKRILIFCGSIQSAEILADHTYHSKTSTEDYKLFNDKKINRLAVVSALNEGHNMTDVDMAILVQVNSKKRNYIQRQGRAIRWREDHEAKILVLYSEKTVDFKWVISSLKGIDPDKIHFKKRLI